ncbi:MAG: WD40 repeat domain-containing protein [Leptolyngbyaceae cyanobacterium]
MMNLRKIGSFSTLLSLSCFASACFLIPPSELETEDSNLKSYRIEPSFEIITAIDFAPNKNLLLVTGEKEFSAGPENSTVEIWDINERRLIQTLETEIGNNSESIFVLNDSQEILVVDTSGEIALLNIGSGVKERTVVKGSVERGPQTIYSLNSDFSHSQQILARGTYLGPLTLLDIQTEEEIELFSIKDSGYTWDIIKFSHDGRYLTALAYAQHGTEINNKRKIYVFDIENRELIGSIEIDSSKVHRISAFLANGQILIPGDDGLLEIRNIETGDVVQDLSIRTPFDHRAIEVIPGKNLVAVTSSWNNGIDTVMGLITVWNLDSGEPLCSTARMMHGASVNGHFEVSPDGRKLVTNEGNTLIIWDIEDCLSL